jgi:hypothetical protein
MGHLCGSNLEIGISCYFHPNSENMLFPTLTAEWLHLVVLYFGPVILTKFHKFNVGQKILEGH